MFLGESPNSGNSFTSWIYSPIIPWTLPFPTSSSSWTFVHRFKLIFPLWTRSRSTSQAASTARCFACRRMRSRSVSTGEPWRTLSNVWLLRTRTSTNLTMSSAWWTGWKVTLTPGRKSSARNHNCRTSSTTQSIEGFTKWRTWRPWIVYEWPTGKELLKRVGRKGSSCFACWPAEHVDLDSTVSDGDDNTWTEEELELCERLSDGKDFFGVCESGLGHKMELPEVLDIAAEGTVKRRWDRHEIRVNRRGKTGFRCSDDTLEGDGWNKSFVVVAKFQHPVGDI